MRFGKPDDAAAGCFDHGFELFVRACDFAHFAAVDIADSGKAGKLAIGEPPDAGFGSGNARHPAARFGFAQVQLFGFARR